MGLFNHSKNKSADEDITVQELKGDHLSTLDSNTTTATASGSPQILKTITIHDIKAKGCKQHTQELRSSDGSPSLLARYKRPMLHPNEISLFGAHSDILASCRLQNWSSNLLFHLGDPDLTNKEDWSTVQTNCLSMKAWKFPVEQGTRMLEWRRTHDKSLGATRWGQRDHKLVDVETGEVLGVFVCMCKVFGRNEAFGRVELFVPLDERTEVAALVVLLGAEEGIRRSEQAAANGAGS